MKTGVAAVLLLAATTLYGGSSIVATKAALATASPYATTAGLSVLKRGGNAIDAAVAVAFALAVTHPQAGNIGGGGILVYYDAKSKGIWTLDFTETAPAETKTAEYEKAPAAAVTGSRSCGVPGTIAGLAAAHERFGSRPWKELIAPAIALARQGIAVDAELLADLSTEQTDRKISQFDATAAVFFQNGKPVPAGTKLVQSDLASTLERIASAGAKDFYDGETAKRLIEGVRAAGGILSFRDLREYKPVWRAPLRIEWGGYSIFTAPPPSGGGIVLGEALQILSNYDLAAAGFQSPRAVHIQAEALRRAWIDRNNYVGDPASVRIPYRELLSAQRAAQWIRSIDDRRATPTVSLTAPDPRSSEGPHTTHFSIVDAEGNIVALTTTLHRNFGSGMVVPRAGFFLNDALSGFNGSAGRANAMAAGRRAVTSLAPTIVLRGEKPFMALGTRGGPAIPGTILGVILNVIVYGKSLTDAIAAPRFDHEGMPEDIFFEAGRAPRETLDALASMGHGMRGQEMIGDVEALMFEDGRITAVADPRRGGAAGGY